eukprot:SAG22_NODE_7343_length_749_cov_1.653846_1_plen_166_part_00
MWCAWTIWTTIALLHYCTIALSHAVVPFRHGWELFVRAKHSVKPLWLLHADHNDVIKYPVFYEYLVRVLLVCCDRQTARKGTVLGTVAAEAQQKGSALQLTGPVWSRTRGMDSAVSLLRRALLKQHGSIGMETEGQQNSSEAVPNRKTLPPAQVSCACHLLTAIY